MFYFIATILLNVVISVLFKVFPRYKIDTLQTIVVNYCVCVITGSLFIGRVPFHVAELQQPWFPWAVLMGAGFISIFNLLAFCTRVDGITTATISNKLSLVIPVLFAIAFFHEGAGVAKIAGIVLAFPAVYLTTRVKEDNGKIPNLLWPILLFVGSGLLDTIVNFVQHNYLGSSDVQATYTVFVFGVAACIGLALVATLVLLKKVKLEAKNIIAGIAIGVPNYFSIYFLIRSLNSNVMQSSASIPVINIGVLVASSLAAIIFFREKVNTQRIIGLVLAVVAIYLIAFQPGMAK
jgi:drug/metabolite transporter (DMT)-like permease